MKKISEITRRDIFDILTTGITLHKQSLPFQTSHDVKMFYCGRLNEVDFLRRLYNLQELPSYDSRFKDAEGDIWQHTINNEDWEIDWIFNDNRFSLVDGEDKYLLNFICEIFHPAVRNEKLPWQEFFTRINQLLQSDGYELYEKEHISGRSVYGWRVYDTNNKVMQSQSENITDSFDTDYVRMQIGLMNDLIYTAPHSAIGKSKELLEICCKTILDEQNIAYSQDLDLIQLMRTACDSINLTPKKVAKDALGNEIAGRILGNLTNIAQGMAELRNLYGDGHGKNRNFKPLPPRYANLAVGTAVTAVNFIWNTYIERKEKTMDNKEKR